MSDTITATALDRLRDLLDRFDTDGVQGVFEADYPDEPEGTSAYAFMFGVLEQRARVVVRDAARLRANSYKDRALDAEAERDRYREALQKIADSPYWHEADFYARRVLDGGQP